MTKHRPTIITPSTCRQRFHASNTGTTFHSHSSTAQSDTAIQIAFFFQNSIHVDFRLLETTNCPPHAVEPQKVGGTRPLASLLLGRLNPFRFDPTFSETRGAYPSIRTDLNRPKLVSLTPARRILHVKHKIPRKEIL